MGLVAEALGRWFDVWRQRQGLVTPLFFAWPRGGKILLHVGCGQAHKEHLSPVFQADDWHEVRLDIDPSVYPDIRASMLDMGAVPDAAADAIFSSHNIEHLYPHETAAALAEFLRVLKPDGLLVLTCPDLQSICQRVADGAADAPAYVSAVGPIAPLDMLYGHRPQLAAGNLFMAHHFGYTLETLTALLRTAGFPSVIARRSEAAFSLWCIASRRYLTADELQQLASDHFPG